MNKNTHIVIYALLFTSIIILFFLYFSNPSVKSEDNISPINEKEAALPSDLNNVTDTLNGKNFRIAYVNSDTVSKYYEFAQKVQKTLLGKRNEAERQIKNKYTSYQGLVRDFEKSSPIMGDREKMEKAQNIRLLEQEIMKVEQELSEQLANEELLMTQSYIIKTNDFMQVIGKNLGFDYVLSYRIGGPMLYANPSLEITSQIIDLLNTKYQSEN
jgi:outer membrane protein